ncbi:hypothetical protein PHLGIDRAFT_125960 [Phlebiopsis gigantea 11061_1 CR5-6]|uniref:Cyclin N-terminal domain-containing protein n=1 Tax=Phlebiopsis gigantea (strain 11061_1 CR5-6) TaxID=745531 RepID=A0A0C3SDP1_PHLG1|nr:hypothetical protein PHLGIDRAFT_125960 [Phlebiopsis gigantea 11061_1 CR5-6]
MAVAVCSVPQHPSLYHPYSMHHSHHAHRAAPVPATHPYAPPKARGPVRRSGPLELPLSAPFFDYVVDRLADTVAASLDPAERGAPLKEPRLRWWVEQLIARSRCRTSTVLVALTYLDKARPNLRISTGFWACERALIGALILANKFTNDEVFSTRTWAQASHWFAAKDVVRAERELLQVLCYNLQINSRALASHYKAIVARCRHLAINPAAFASRQPPSPQTFPVASSSRLPALAPNAMASIHALRRISVDSAMSSGSASPMDSPELQTPESYPASLLAHGSADAKRIQPPVSYVTPYSLANGNRGIHSQDASSIPAYDEPRPYLFAPGKDFGDALPEPQPSLLAELLEDLDPQYIPQSRLTEIGLPFMAHNLPPVPPQWMDFPQQYAENPVSWAPAPPVVQNTLSYVF